MVKKHSTQKPSRGGTHGNRKKLLAPYDIPPICLNSKKQDLTPMICEPYCTACGCDLTGAPKVVLVKNLLCYRCAKAAYPRVRNDRFSNAKLAFDRRKKAFEKAHKIWGKDKDAFVMQGRLMLIERFWFWAALGLGLLYAELMFGLVIFILSPFIPIGISEHLTKTKLNDFQKNNVEPKLYEREPLEETFHPEMFCRETDGTKLKNSDYRPEILERDEFTCQSCSKLKPAEDLEIHHVIPKAKGGLDIPTNLITLCIPCHDREDWFGHFRKYPTTICNSGDMLLNSPLEPPIKKGCPEAALFEKP